MTPHNEPTGSERRARLRREVDVEKEAIVQNAPVVDGLLRTGKVATAMLAFGTLLGAAGGAFGMRLSGPKDDTDRLSARVDSIETRRSTRLDSLEAKTSRNAVRMDDVMSMLVEIRNAGTQQAYTVCIIARRIASDVRPQGCDEAGRKP